MTYNELMNKVMAYKPRRGAWHNGIHTYATMILEDVIDDFGDINIDPKTFKEVLLNGAKDWKEYSYGGCALIYNGDIVETLCPPSLQKKYKYGEKTPSYASNWLDIQSRALTQAHFLLIGLAK